MFGGIVFMLRGNMLVGAWKHSLIVRLGEEQAEAALMEPHVKPFDITGKPTTRWAMVAGEGVQENDQLKKWIQRALKLVAKMAAKEAVPSRTYGPKPSIAGSLRIR